MTLLLPPHPQLLLTYCFSHGRRGMFGALHVLRQEPTYATALTETDGVAYTLESTKLNKMLEEDSTLSKEILYSLSKEVFRMSKLRTPLFEQASRRPPSPLPTYSCLLNVIS